MTRYEPPGEERVLEAEALDARGPVTLAELCRACGIDADTLLELIDAGVIEPQAGQRPSEWCFAPVALVRVQRAVRLRQDLAIDPAGAALALDLIEEITVLRRRVRWLEGHGGE